MDGLFGRKARQDCDGRTAVQRIEHGAGPGKAVIHRQYAEYVVRRPDVEHLLQHFGIAREVPVGEHRALRYAGCAGGVDDRAG